MAKSVAVAKWHKCFRIEFSKKSWFSRKMHIHLPSCLFRCGTKTFLSEKWLSLTNQGIMPAKRVGERIRQHRHRLGYSQEYLGSKAGLSHSTVSKMEAGNYALSLGHLEALANALGIQPEDLVRDQPTHTKAL
jgi:DNA-binding XRE family transcriptional regulator